MEVVLKKGSIVKIDGLPYELLEDVHATGASVEVAQSDRQTEDRSELLGDGRVGIRHVGV